MINYNMLYKKYGFSLIQRLLRRPTIALYYQFMLSERRDGTTIRSEQLIRLGELYKHVRDHVPLYQRLYAHGPETIQSFESFASLPILDRSDVASRSEEMVVGGPRNPSVSIARTGGSSGEPLTFYAFVGAASLGLAMMMRARRWWGIDFNERNALFIEHGLAFEVGMKSRIDRALHNVRESILNRRFFSAYRMSEADMAGYYRDLLAFKPIYLIGYSTFLYLFAKYLAEKELSASPIGVKCIFYTSEMLYPWQRQVIEEVFHCPVVGEYGCKELGVVAYQCPEGNWHTMDESVYVEVQPLADVPGYGEVLLTQLRNDYSPFLRYRTGDIAQIVDTDIPCPCGRGLHVMGPIEGRSHDWIITPSGKALHGQIFTHALIVNGSVDKFRVYQAGDYSITIEAVVNSRFSDNEERALQRNLAEVIGEPLPLSFRRVDDIESGNSGKFRWIKSDISIYQRPAVYPD